MKQELIFNVFLYFRTSAFKALTVFSAFAQIGSITLESLY